METSKSLFNRICINDLVTRLRTLTYDEVNFEKLISMFPNADWQDFFSLENPIEMKGFSVDDFNFKLYRVDDSQSNMCSAFILNHSMIIDRDVEVWVANEDNEAQFRGTLSYEDGKYHLTVECEVL